MDNNEKTNSTLQDNYANSLNKLLIEVLGADFDAEKTKALESKLTNFIGKTTVPRAVFSDSNSKLKELKTKLSERAEKNKGSEEWEKKAKAINLKTVKALLDLIILSSFFY